MRAYFAISLGLLFFLSVEIEWTWAQELSPDSGRTGLTATGNGVVGSEPEMVSPDTIQFPNNPVSDFLVVYEKLKGVTLIKDASLLGGGANLSLTLNQPVSKAEAIRLIESTLLLNGYAFIALDKNAVKVINTAGGKNPRSEGVFLFTNESELPEGEVVASYVMPLTHLAAADAVPIFEQFITLHPYGSLVPVPVANQVLITENATLIRRLIQVRDLIDTPAPERKTDFIQLAQANADRVVELITQILEKREEKSGGTAAKAATGQSAQPGIPGLPGAAGGSAGVTISGSKSGFAGDIQLIADTRTNRILVVASPFDFASISSLIKQFDISVELSDPYEQPLNYVSASDMLPILQDMLQEEGDDAAATGGAGASRTVSGGIGVGGVTGGSAGTSGTSGTAANPADILSEPGEQAAAESIVVGKTRIIADNRANSILVIGQPESRDKVKAILTKLDKRPMQVYLATVIGQLLVTNADAFAVNILQRFTGDSTSGVNSVGGGRSMITTNTPLMQSAATMAQLANVAASNGLPGMQIAAFIGNTLNVYVSALTLTGKFRVASRPSVFTANNKKATIFQGKKIAVPTSTVTTLGGGGSAVATSGSQQSNIQYQDVVLKIEVVPLINSAREISLQIVETNDTLAKGPDNQTEIGGGVLVPKIDTQKLTTTVIVPDGATILMGGLITQEDAKTSSGIPFISTVPLIGNLFKSTTDDIERRELVVMIQPSVVFDVPELKEVSKTERDLTGFSSKELSPLSLKSGQKSIPMSLNPPAAKPISSAEAKQE
jgi:type II secretion system protein D